MCLFSMLSSNVPEIICKISEYLLKMILTENINVHFKTSLSIYLKFIPLSCLKASNGLESNTCYNGY